MNSMRSSFSRPPFFAPLTLLLLATTFAALSTARADTLVDVGFEAFGPFSKDADLNSEADLLRWTMSDLGLSPAHGNPPEGAFARTVDSTIGGARTGDRVFEFTLTPLSGYTISISSVSFDVAAQWGSTGASQVAQMFGYTNLDAQATPVAAGFAIDSTTGDGPSPFTNFSTDLSANSLYQNVAAQIVFSFYIFGSNTDSFAHFDNIRVTGVTAAVPEPSSIALLALSGLALASGAVFRQSRRKLRFRIASHATKSPE